MKPTDLVDQSSLREDIPDFAPGDTLKVTVVMKPKGANPDTPPTCEIYIHRDDKDLKQQAATSRLNSDGNYEASTEFQLPSLLKEGAYEVRVVVPPNTTAKKTLTVNQ